MLLGEIGVDPRAAMWMTFREISAALRGRQRAERTRLVTVAQAFGQDLSEREIQRIIEGEPARQALPHEEQERSLKAMREKHGWGN